MTIEITVPCERVFDYDGVEELFCAIVYHATPIRLRVMVNRCNPQFVVGELKRYLAPGSEIEEFRVWEEGNDEHYGNRSVLATD